MASETHARARAWASERLGAHDVGDDAPFHLRDPGGRRVRVAGRHIEGREPNYFHVAPTLTDEFDDLVVILFDPDWTVRYAYRLPLEAVIDHHRQPGDQGCRLMIVGDDSWRTDSRVERLA
jgi:hypothetical protein